MEGAPRTGRRLRRGIPTIDWLRAAVLPALALALVAGGFAAASAADRILVRIGNHAGYDRAVIDWPGVVDYDVAAEDRQVRITFARAADLDLAPMLRKFGSVASDLKAETAGEATTLSFALPPRVQLKHFRNEKSVVLDFVRDVAPSAPPLEPASMRALAQERRAKGRDVAPTPGQPPAAPSPPQSAAAQPASPAAAAPGASPPQAASASPASAPAAQRPAGSPPPAPEAPQLSGQILVPPPPPASNAGLAALPNPALQPPQPLIPPSPPVAASAPARAVEPPPAEVPPPSSTPARAAPAAEGSAEAATPPAPAAPPAPASPPLEAPAVAPPPVPPLVVGPLPMRNNGAAERVTVEVQPSAVGYRLRIPVRETTGVAAFMRGNVAWIVLDSRLALDLAKLVAARNEIGIADTMIVEAPVTATVLRVAPPGRGGIGVLRENGAWVFELGPRAPVPLRPIDAVVRGNPDGTGGRLVVDLPGGRPTLRVKDPELKDELQIVPTTTHGAAVTTPRAHGEFRVLPAAQGFVVVPLSDRVVTRFAGEIVEVVGGVDLVVTEGLATASGTEAPRRQQLLDAAAWAKISRPIDAEKQALHRAVAMAVPQSRGNQRLALSQFLFAHGYYHEALGQLRILDTEAPKTAGLPATRLLHAAAAMLADDLEDAERTIAHASLAQNNEAALWRGLLMLKQGDAKGGLEHVRRGMEFAERYPTPMGPRVAIAIAETHILAGQADEGGRFLEIAQRQPLGDSDRQRIQLLRGHLLARQGDAAGAVARWSELEKSMPSPARTEAIIARVQLQIAAKQIDYGQGIETLDRLRYAWRGDRLELDTLVALSRLHARNLNFRAALTTLRDAAANFPQAREAGAVLSEMDLVFAKLFLDGEARKLPPVQAIALFDEFRDLVPMGSRGDQMVRNLVDRLVQVDLLDRAVQILDHQIKHRSTDVERPELGARLALVRLMDGNPEAAITSLRETDSAAAAPEVRAERKRIAARAFAELGRGSEAIVELAGDMSAEADRMRVEILRKGREWKESAAVLGRLVGEPPSPGEELREGQGLDVLHYATALGLAGDEAALQQLRERFGPAMEKSPYKALFDVIGGQRGEVPSDMEAVAQRIEAVAPYQSFLQAYRERFNAKSAGGS
ncbi:MAG: hypothetical protein JNK67_02870 [Alphaproteobacteria bacterium]|nr:hypothetical protein [Alphaproteobacteria bacterium]